MNDAGEYVNVITAHSYFHSFVTLNNNKNETSYLFKTLKLHISKSATI